MINKIVTIYLTVVKTTKIKLTGDQLLAILRDENSLDHLSIPKDAKVEFQVPGGGDWSNMTLDIDAAHPIEISWTTKTEDRQDHVSEGED